MLIKCCVLTILFFIFINVKTVESVTKYRMCVVDGKGEYQQSDNHCPKLETPESQVQCVKGLDRYDCLRKIHKGAADFGIFTPEDLIAAMNTGHDILITNELRIASTERFEEEVVAVVRDSSRIKSIHDLHDKVLCHPGYGSQGFVSEILANLLERTILRSPSCDASLTVPENRLLSSSKFFKSACKPGPWVNDPAVDRELKGKYRNLCGACSSPMSCSINDKYYGSSGSLLCLTDGAGDIAWTTNAQVRLQFGLDNNNTGEWSNYKFLCKNDVLRGLNETKTDFCTWVSKPWPVIGASRASATAIQNILSNISHTQDWRGGLLDLLEVVSYHVVIYTLDGTDAVDTYLSKIPGYVIANSFTACQPLRTVKICTTSIPAQYKCGWMREAAAVQGLEPDIDCLKADNATHCMDAIQKGIADVVVVHPDYLNVAESKYNLKTLFYETVENDNKYLTMAVVNQKSKIMSIEDLKGKRACFPSYDGVSWNSVVYELTRRKLLSGCPYDKAMEDFFGDSCVPGVPFNYSSRLEKLCRGDDFKGDEGALNCLKEGVGDVAFVSQNNLREFILDKKNMRHEFRILICPNEPCHLSWSAVGQAMVSNNISTWREKDILDVFLELDSLLGTSSKESTRMFTMYGEFDGKHNVLFNDKTVQLKKIPRLRSYDDMPRVYNEILENRKTCQEEYSSSARSVPSILVLFIILKICFI